MENKEWKMHRITKNTSNKDLLKTVNSIVNEKKLTKLQIYLILKALQISEIMVVNPLNIDEPDFQPNWLLKELKKTNILAKEYWKARILSLRKG